MSENKTCQAEIQQGEKKGELCGKPTDNKYCKKHKRHEIIDKANQENIRYCDIARGCYTTLEDHQTKCTQCLHKARIRDRKNDGKKRQDPNLCLDCGNNLTDTTRAKGKHDKKLRRCIPCYEKLLRVESQRGVRERNYKEEGFKNKYVIWNHYVKGAKKRGIDFNLKKDVFNLLIVQKCFYCDYIKDGEVNGIDRIDNNKGYIDTNIVSCCEACNSSKGTQHPQEFIDKLYLIHNHKLSKEYDNSILDKWKDTYLSKISPKFSTYMKSANSRNIQFKINETEFNEIIQNSCYLCGISSSDNNKNGIDRVENNNGYIYDNCKSCCGHCNLLKKTLSIEKVFEISERVYTKYDELTTYFKDFDIKKRDSKIEPRHKIINPDEADIEKREYKTTNEIIIPNIVPEEISKILDKTEEIIEIKQWKVKQIYETISTNNENIYKAFCEKTTDITKIPTWNTDWASFVLSVKDKSLKDSEKIIRDFVENLRRIRHNSLCYDKNAKILDRDDRQQWPATTIVRAYLDGKIDTFKKYTEAQTGDNPEDVLWQKRWDSFILSLNDNKQNSNKLKDLCSKFLAAQRTKRYRNKK